MQPFDKLTVVGLGLIGGSLAMAAREVYPTLVIQGVDPDSKTLQYALQSQIVDQVALTLPTEYEENHLIVLASHLSINVENLKNLAPHVFGREIVVSDAGSCKRAICQLGAELLPKQFIGGHPMAGKEFSGISNAASLLFNGKSYLLCPSESVATSHFEKLKTFVQQIGAVPRTVEPEAHDRYMAFVSHFPQLYSILLTNVLYNNKPGHLLSYQGGGIDDQMRLAASPYAMWGDILKENQDNLRMVLEQFTQLIDEAGRDLDQPAMAEWFSRANLLHREFQEYRQNR